METENITTTVTGITYNNGNFFILRTNDGVVKGNIFDCGDDPASIVGMKYRFTGKWSTDKYGTALQIEHAEMQSNQIFFFLSRIVKNVGDALANLMIEIYGDELETVIEENPNELLNVKGIGKKKLSAILSSWDKYKHLRQLTKFVGEYGLTQGLISKIYNRFQDNAISILKANPYRLTEIPGIGFLVADELALKMGIDHCSSFRINSCCEHVLAHEADSSGHSYLSATICFSKMHELLKTTEITNKMISEVIKENQDIYSEIIANQMLIGLVKYKKYEDFISDYIHKNKAINLETYTKEEIAEFLENYEKSHRIILSDRQKWSIFKASTMKLFALSGYAGTGKSSISKIFMTLLAKRYGEENIVGCALSGIAARRISDVSGFPAFTIHSLLGFQEGEFVYNQDNRLPYKVVILDEAGMVSAAMFYLLVSALSEDAIFIMIGDDAQLPPIGAGNVFGDVINKKLTSLYKLEQVYRQSDESVITLFAQDIRKGCFPENHNKDHKDWKHISCTPHDYWRKFNSSDDSGKKAIKSEIAQLIRNKVEEMTRSYLTIVDDILTDFQILVPQKKGDLGTYELNKVCQQIYINPSTLGDSDKLVKGGNLFCVGDKVVHTSNKEMDVVGTTFGEDGNPQKTRIFNGTLGIITNIDHENGIVIVRLNIGISIIYDFVEMGDIVELAYALTVHKAQGSEFKNVLIPLTSSHYMMLNNQWFYTAVTRAKTQVTIISDDSAFKRACTNKDKKVRNTWLSLDQEAQV